MKNEPSVLLLSGDLDGGCGFYRMREPARVAEAAGVDVGVDTGIDSDATINTDGSVTVRSLSYRPDVIVFQRPVMESEYQTLVYAKNHGTAVVVEIDDDLRAIHRQNQVFHHLQPKTSPWSNWEWFSKCCEEADLVITSTPALAEKYAKHGRFRVIRNLMPEEVFNNEHDYQWPARLGWTGTLQTHPVDLDVAGAHINAALAGSGDRDFYVVGDGVGVEEKLYLSGDVRATGWVPRHEYIDTLNEHFDVGVVPLNLDQFNEGKSWLKHLEMSSQGIPSVVSPTSENLKLAGITGAPVATKPRDWQKHLKSMLLSKEYMIQKGNEAKDSVRGLTYENHADMWIDAWKTALDNSTRRRYSSR